MKGDNLVTQYVERGFDYKPVEIKCGNTGVHGQRALCDKCQNDTELQNRLRVQDENTEADNAWLRSAGWGEM
jgi:hypothetical protein